MKINLEKKWVSALVLLAVIVGLAAFWAGRAGLFSPRETVVDADPEPVVIREVILYFADRYGEYLVAEHRELPDCPDNEQCVQAVMEALIGGPSGELIPVVPPQTTLLGVVLDEDTATLDFSRDLVTRHPGGSISELLTVYGVANTLAVNFPHLRQVRFLIAGQATETLRGHVDLRAPVPADFRYGRPPLRSGDDERGLASPADRSLR